MKLPGRFFERDENLVVLIGLIGGAALVLTLLAIYAYVIPETESQTETLASYEHTGRYTYSVATEPSALNPSDTIGPVLPEDLEDSGEPPPPIFTKLARGLEFVYGYQLLGASEVSGTVSAVLEIKAGTSWTEKISLVEPVAFQGATGGIEGIIDFTQIAALLQQVEEQTGVTSGSVDLTIIPTVEIQATSNGQQINETYSSPLTFVYTSNLITPGETLSFSEPKTITATVERDNEINLFGGSVLVTTVREIAAPLAVATLALSGVFAAIFFLGVGRSETASVRSRYRGLIVPVAEVESLISHRISVGSLLDLAALAKRENRSLFVRDFDNGSQAYLMHDGMVVYQYTVGDVPQGWIRSPGSEPALVAQPVTQPVAAPIAQELPWQPPVATTLVQEETAFVEEVVEEPVTAAPEEAIVEEPVAAAFEEAEKEEAPALVEAVEEPVAQAEAVEDEVRAIAKTEVAEELVAPALIEAETAVPETVEEPAIQASAVEDEVRAIAESELPEAFLIPTVTEAEIAAAETVEEPVAQAESVEDEVHAIAESELPEELVPPALTDTESAVAETVEEPMAQAEAVEDEVRAIAESELPEEFVAPALTEAETVDTETVEEPAIQAAAVDDEVRAIAETEVAEAFLVPTVIEAEIAVAETVEEPAIQAAAVEDEVRAIAESEVAEAFLVPTVIEEETAVAETVEAVALTPVEDATSNEQPEPVALTEAPVEAEETDFVLEAIPEWLTMPQEPEDYEEIAETVPSPDETVQEEVVASLEERHDDQASEAPVETESEDPWALPQTATESDAVAESVQTSREVEEAPAVVAEQQVQGDPAELAWRRPQGTAGDSVEAASDATAETGQVVAVAEEEATDQTATAVQSHVRPSGYTRAHSSPRPAVRRWLRNRSGGPLLEETHTRESGPSAESESPQATSDFTDGNGNGHHEEPEAVESPVEVSAEQSPEVETDALQSEPEMTPVEADVETNIAYDEPSPEVEFDRSPEEVAFDDVSSTESPASPDAGHESEPELETVAVTAETPASEETPASSAPGARREPAALDRKLVRYARRWLRDFLDDESNGRPDKQ